MLMDFLAAVVRGDLLTRLYFLSEDVAPCVWRQPLHARLLARRCPHHVLTSRSGTTPFLPFASLLHPTEVGQDRGKDNAYGSKRMWFLNK